VTYCFRVENTGDLPLFPVVIDDPDLGITQDDMTLVSGDDTAPLLPGEVLVYSYETTITADLLNTATTTGTPSDVEGAPIPDADDVTDTNDAAVERVELFGSLNGFCDNDTPLLAYVIDAAGLATEATITFSNNGQSESMVVPVGVGTILWPGAVVDANGDPIDWPGWDQDADGNWFLNPDNPYAWARGSVQVSAEVNPTIGPVTISYPPAEPTCNPNPPPERLPKTGADSDEMGLFGLVLLGLGLTLVGGTHVIGRRRES
jgi:LPXTG-motif cell wall-anchored protein